jgi:hypothetical protein
MTGGEAVLALDSPVALRVGPFVFTSDNKWQYNLKASSLTVPGSYRLLYTVTMEPGDDYVILPTCTGTFVIE